MLVVDVRAARLKNATAFLLPNSLAELPVVGRDEPRKWWVRFAPEGDIRGPGLHRVAKPKKCEGPI
jgi:hypothetical protein